MRIDYLANHVELVPTIAEWQLQAAGTESFGADETDEQVAALNDRLHRDRVPLTLVALSGSAPIGTASLVEHDLPDRPELTPWLAAVFVPRELRRQGIGSALVRRAIEEAWELGYERIFSLVREQVELAAELGWRIVEKVPSAGADAAIMETRPEHRRSG